MARFEALLPGKPLRRAFQMFFHALLPRGAEAGRTDDVQRPLGRGRRLAQPAGDEALGRVRPGC